MKSASHSRLLIWFKRPAVFELLVQAHLNPFDNPSHLLPCVVRNPGIVHAVLQVSVGLPVGFALPLSHKKRTQIPNS